MTFWLLSSALESECLFLVLLLRVFLLSYLSNYYFFSSLRCKCGLKDNFVWRIIFQSCAFTSRQESNDTVSFTQCGLRFLSKDEAQLIWLPTKVPPPGEQSLFQIRLHVHFTEHMVCDFLRISFVHEPLSPKEPDFSVLTDHVMSWPTLCNAIFNCIIGFFFWALCLPVK